MNALFRESFWRDVNKIKATKTLSRVYAIIEAVEKAASLSEIRNVTKMAGSDNAYRIRVGGFRIGVFVEGNTVEFARCLDRKDMYRYFP